MEFHRIFQRDQTHGQPVDAFARLAVHQRDARHDHDVGAGPLHAFHRGALEFRSHIAGLGQDPAGQAHRLFPVIGPAAAAHLVRCEQLGKFRLDTPVLHRQPVRLKAGGETVHQAVHIPHLTMALDNGHHIFEETHRRIVFHCRAGILMHHPAYLFPILFARDRVHLHPRQRTAWKRDAGNDEVHVALQQRRQICMGHGRHHPDVFEPGGDQFPQKICRARPVHADDRHTADGKTALLPLQRRAEMQHQAGHIVLCDVLQQRTLQPVQGTKH